MSTLRYILPLPPAPLALSTRRTTQPHWVFTRISLHLVLDDLVKVDVEHVGHLDVVDHHVGEFLVHVLPVAVARLVAPLGPSEQIDTTHILNDDECSMRKSTNTVYLQNVDWFYGSGVSLKLMYGEEGHLPDSVWVIE